MARVRKLTAHRPSQSSQEFVINSRGEKVRNTAYTPHSKQPPQERGSMPVRNDFNNTRKQVHQWEDIDVSDAICDVDFSGYRRSNQLSTYDEENDFTIGMFQSGDNVYCSVEMDDTPRSEVRRTILRKDGEQQFPNAEEYIDRVFGGDTDRYNKMEETLQYVYADGLVRYSEENDSPYADMFFEFVDTDDAHVALETHLPADSRNEISDIIDDVYVGSSAVSFATPSSVQDRILFVEQLYLRGEEDKILKNGHFYPATTTDDVKRTEDIVGKLMNGNK